MVETAELKAKLTMLSGAFVSRIGMPIVFDQLNGKDCGLLIEQAIKKAILSAATQMDLCIQNVMIKEGLGLRIMSSLPASSLSFGARALMEHSRSLAAKAVMELRRKGDKKGGDTLHVSLSGEGNLALI